MFLSLLFYFWTVVQKCIIDFYCNLITLHTFTIYFLQILLDWLFVGLLFLFSKEKSILKRRLPYCIGAFSSSLNWLSIHNLEFWSYNLFFSKRLLSPLNPIVHICILHVTKTNNNYSPTVTHGKTFVYEFCVLWIAV